MSTTPASNATNNSPSSAAAKKRKKGSMYSLASSARGRAPQMRKDEIIGKRINDILKAKEQNMFRTIEAAMYENNHAMYNKYRVEFEEKIDILEKERGKILRKKKNKKEKIKMLHENSYQRLFYIANAVNNTVKQYKKLYFENDFYRQKRIMEIEENPQQTEEQIEKTKLEQLKSFYDSPFKEDRRFAIIYISQLTRDSLAKSHTIVNELFFDKIFDLVLMSDEGTNKMKSFDILTNLIHSEEQRLKLANQDYLKRVYETFQGGPKATDSRTLEKISWMTTLICFYPDMIEQIIRLNLLQFILKISGHQYATAIRSNAVLALSLLTYHEKMFDELIKRGVIDMVMDLCKNNSDDIQVKQYSTLALVHFALNKQSINILIQKGVMDLFNSFGSIDNSVIQTNVSWIFLALCNNGITGKTMVENGITRDMFLVSCNPQFNQIRHLVIAGFAELGRCTELKDAEERVLTPELQKIKETAIVGMHKNFKSEAEKTIQILLKYTVSESELFKTISYWALKDYILLNHENLIADINGIIQAFVNGSIYPIEEVNTECANAVSFLITHHIVYSDHHQIADNEQSNYVLDALMHLTGSTSKFIRTRAFSTLSTLSTYCSSYQSVMEQIHRDIKLPSNKTSRQYYDFIMQRLQKGVETFTQSYFTIGIEENFAGLFCLLSIAKDPTTEVITDAAERMFNFIFSPKTDPEKDTLNEIFFIYVFQALKHAVDPDILFKVLKVIKYYIRFQSPLQSQVINPDTILWILQILEEHKDNKLLCCKAAVTMLQIVSEHQIEFDYQEVAIIKKFNQALQNLDVFERHALQSEVQTEESKKEGDLELKVDDMKEAQQDTQKSLLQETPSRHSASQSNKSIAESESQKSSKTIPPGELEQQLDQQQEEEEEEKQSIRSFKHSDKTTSKSIMSAKDMGEALQKSLEQVAASLDKVNVELPNTLDRSAIVAHQEDSKASKSQKYVVSAEIKDDKKNQPSQQNSTHSINNSQQEGGSQLQKKEEEVQNSILQSLMIIDNINNQPYQMSHHSLPQQQTRGSIYLVQSEQPHSRGYTNVKVLKDALVSSKKRLMENKNNSLVINPTDKAGSNTNLASELNNALLNMSINLENDTVMEQALRESIIKSFMVIFTHNHSQHLLLNRDLIDIAFNCLEFAVDIADEAQQKLAKLISIIFKFPQVQDYMMKREVILGVTNLLAVYEHRDILSNTIKACTYLTMNYDFVVQPLSLELLKRLMDLFQFFTDYDSKPLFNLIFSITNILRGDNKNKVYFLEQGGCQKFIQFIINQNDPKFTDQCVQSLKEITSYKSTLKTMIKQQLGQEESGNQGSLRQVFIKCLDMTDAWAAQVQGGRREGGIGASGQKNQEQYAPVKHQKPSSDIHIMEKLVQEDQDRSRSILFASKHCLIRNNIYYILARSIKSGFSIAQAQIDCRLISRLLQDLSQSDFNYFMFENLLLTFNSLENDADFVQETLSKHQQPLFKMLHEYPQQDHKIALLKEVINLVLKSMELLCNSEEGKNLFTQLFRLIEMNKADEDVQENIIWLVNSMIDQGETQNVIEVCLSNHIVHIVSEQLSPEKRETTILQTLHTLSSLSKNAELLDHFMEYNVFNKLQLITTTPFFSRNLELRTALYQLLEVVTNGNKEVCHQLMSQGFILVMIRELNNNRYLVEKANYDDMIMDIDLSDEDVTLSKEKSYLLNEEDTLMNAQGHQQSSLMNLKNIIENPGVFGFSTSQSIGGEINTQSMMYDTLDRHDNANQLLESIVQTIANICQATSSNHQSLLDFGLIDIIKTLLLNYCPYGYFSAAKQPTDQIDVTNLTIGNISMLKSLSQIVHSLTKNMDVQENAIKQDIVSVIKHLNRLREYEVLTNTFLSLGNLMLSQVEYVRRRAVDLGCLEILLDSNENSDFLRIRRICNSVLSQTDSRLFEYNDAIRGTNRLSL